MLGWALKIRTGCPNKFAIRSEMFASKANYVYKKNVFRSKKLLFEPFFPELQIENGLLKQLFFNLLNKFQHKIKFLKGTFLILQFDKKAQKAIF